MNENEKSQFVVLPKKENGELLQKFEILVYVAIRYNMNSKTMTAHPSLDTISKRTGCSIPSIRKIIKQIVSKGYMTIEVKPGMGTIYTFSNEKSFEPFSYEFLDNEKLNKEEKLQILCTQQFMYKDNGVGKISYTDSELAERTGLNRHSIARTNNSLIQKGLVSQISLKTKDPETGLMGKETIYYLDELGQAIVFKLKDHEGRINKNEEDISSLKKDNELLRRELQELRLQISAKEQPAIEYEF
jgi:DNA-binding MarR family transcriptional regulator